MQKTQHNKTKHKEAAAAAAAAEEEEEEEERKKYNHMLSHKKMKEYVGIRRWEGEGKVKEWINE